MLDLQNQTREDPQYGHWDKSFRRGLYYKIDRKHMGASMIQTNKFGVALNFINPFHPQQKHILA